MLKFGFITTIVAVLGSVWLFFRQILIMTIRLNPNDSLKMNTFLKNTKHWSYSLYEEFDSNVKNDPKIFTKLVSLQGLFFHYSSTERMMQAGFSGKEYVNEITFPRFHYRKMKRFFETSVTTKKEDPADVNMMEPGGYFWKIGTVTSQNLDTDFINLPKDIYEKLDQEIYSTVVSGDTNKTGMILHGLPGNGKTSIIRHFAAKYNIPIQMFVLEPSYTNRDLIGMFSKIPSKSIVLFEDFDSAFNKRQCLIGGNDSGSTDGSMPSQGNIAKFSFDTLLNGLDGVYNNYEGVVFFMTANDLEKIDTAIKHRPSRFRFMVEVTNPDEELRTKILPNKEWVKLTDGANLDNVCLVKELLESNTSEELIKSQLVERM